MILGRVTGDASEARIDLVIHGPIGSPQRIEAVIDTGFTDALTLPVAIVQGLALPLITEQHVILADGQEIAVGVHQATVHWDGRRVDVPVLATGAVALVGMRLLSGSHLGMDVVGGGTVAISPISA